MTTDPKNNNASRAQSHPELTATDNNPSNNGNRRDTRAYRSDLFHTRKMIRQLLIELKRHDSVTRGWNDPYLSTCRLKDIRALYSQVESLLWFAKDRADHVSEINRFIGSQTQGVDNE